MKASKETIVTITMTDSEASCLNNIVTEFISRNHDKSIPKGSILDENITFCIKINAKLKDNVL